MTRVAFLVALLALLVAVPPSRADERRPNVVLIMTDNHGAWTLGCYGNREIRTPNIDRLAAEGILFRRAYCNNSVCSPSRATFLTGLIPSQHGVHCYLPEPRVDEQGRLGGECIIKEFASLPKVLARAGYTCGLSGKWHLGDYLRPQEGFSYWYTMPGGHTYAFHDAQVIWDGKLRTEPRYLTDAITDHAVDFLKRNRSKPFFLFLSYDGPYGVSDCFLKTHQNRHTSYYADKQLDCFPRGEVHPWQRYRANLLNNPIAFRGYAAAVSGIDDGVGRVLDTLARLNLDRDTLVIFTSDQGLSGGHGGMWGLGEHTRPIHTREATVRIPFIVRHPERIRGKQVSDALVCAYDLYPTVLRYLGLADKVPAAPILPGRDLTPLWRGDTPAWDQVIVHEFENVRMIRTADWKYTRRHPSGPDELYDMKNDVDEQHNLIATPAGKARVGELGEQLDKFFERYADPQYDLWRQGKSKVGRLLEQQKEFFGK